MGVLFCGCVGFVICVISADKAPSPLAQLVERETVNLEASGSTPLARDLLHLLLQIPTSLRNLIEVTR